MKGHEVKRLADIHRAYRERLIQPGWDATQDDCRNQEDAAQRAEEYLRQAGFDREGRPL